MHPDPTAPPPLPFADLADRVAAVRREIGQAFIGQEAVLDQLLLALLGGGHVLIEGVPGLGKTLLVRALAAVLRCQFSRVQFTPDLMPSDVMGTHVFDPRTTEFRLRKGPVFTQILLADEINRTPPKTQAALLEAMEERQVTLDGEAHPLPQPFLVFATQNPLEFEGTYPLPEAQQDRFLLKVILDYPSPDQEEEVLRRTDAGFRAQSLTEAGIKPVITADQLADLRAQVNAVRVEDRIHRYIVDLVGSTRNHNDILVGASPRASIALLLTSKALAALRGRDFVIPDDVKDLAIAVLRHRILLRPEAEIEGFTPDRVLASVADAQMVPR